MNSDALKNEVLFELKKWEEWQIHPKLLEFLQASTFPWLCLGKNLTTFLEQLVLSIPSEKRILGTVSPNAYLENQEQIYIAPLATVEAGAFLCGPCYVDNGAVIRHGAYVRGSVFVSSHALVGHTTECKGSILLPKAKAAHFNYVGDSVLGVDCNLGAGTKLANLKINHSNINIRLSNEKILTHLKKFGAILGNRAQTGCNSVTNPGTIMLPDSILLPNQTSLGIVGNFPYS